MKLLKSGKEKENLNQGDKMKKQTMTKSYILFGAFMLTIITVITCGDSSSDVDVAEPKTIDTVKEVVEEKVEEVKVVVEEKVEEVKEVVKEKTEKVIEEKVEELIEEVIPVELPSLPKVEELPIELPEIAPEDTKEEAVE